MFTKFRQDRSTADIDTDTEDTDRHRQTQTDTDADTDTDTERQRNRKADKQTHTHTHQNITQKPPRETPKSSQSLPKLGVHVGPPAGKKYCSRWGKRGVGPEILILAQGILGSGPFCSVKTMSPSQPPVAGAACKRAPRPSCHWKWAVRLKLPQINIFDQTYSKNAIL